METAGMSHQLALSINKLTDRSRKGAAAHHLLVEGYYN